MSERKTGILPVAGKTGFQPVGGSVDLPLERLLRPRRASRVMTPPARGAPVDSSPAVSQPTRLPGHAPAEASQTLVFADGAASTVTPTTRVRGGLSPFLPSSTAFAVHPLGEAAFVEERVFELLQLAPQEEECLVDEADQGIGRNLRGGRRDAVGSDFSDRSDRSDGSDSSVRYFPLAASASVESFGQIRRPR
jgi:hypothetical protein